MTKTLLVVTAVFEGATGLLLLVSPSALAALLLGTELDTPAALTVGRVAGAALVALGIACWLARSDEQSHPARGLLVAMVLYNTAAGGILAHAGAYLGLSGVALWPAVLVHLAMALWCIMCLQIKRG
jgi:hypothetical protein